jgi:cytoskeletal protein CcmA (bactofilin family)
LRAKKVTTQEHVEVGGSINTGGGVTARSIEIGNRATAHGPIRADEIDVGRGAEVEDLYGKHIVLRSGATAGNVFGENVVIESNCRINGEVQYTDNLRQGEHVYYSQTPRKVDALPQ